MTRLAQLPSTLHQRLQAHSALKVIAGLMNFDADSVSRVARAAGRGGADLVDVACNAELVKLAVEASGGLPVCVSSVQPKRHPVADRPMIDFDLVLVMEPLTIAGAVIGSILNKVDGSSPE